MLIDDVKKREREKLRISHLQKQFAETIYFPIIPIVEPILEKMENLDKEDLFLNLVSRDEAPDYYDIVNIFDDVVIIVCLYSRNRHVKVRVFVY